MYVLLSRFLYHCIVNCDRTMMNITCCIIGNQMKIIALLPLGFNSFLLTATVIASQFLIPFLHLVP